VVELQIPLKYTKLRKEKGEVIDCMSKSKSGRGPMIPK
jgi:hypothetical protein